MVSETAGCCNMFVNEDSLDEKDNDDDGLL